LDTYCQRQDEEKGHTYDTVVIDEAHFQSLDYEALLHLLSFLFYNSTLSFRIYLLSINTDRDKFIRLFPTIHFICLPFVSRFPVLYKYNKSFSNTPILQIGIQMKEYVTSFLSKTYLRRSSRIIVFLSSHNQCEQYKTYLENIYGIMDCILYHGKNRPILPVLLNPMSCFILLTTNIMESAVTIPDISLVIDLGVYYQKLPTTGELSLRWCDKTMLEQRAGRTGRTCPGTVIRAFHQSLLKVLRHRNQVEYSWENVILDCMNRGIDAEKVFGTRMIASSMERLKVHGLLNHRLVHFAVRSELEPECAAMMHRFLNRNDDNNRNSSGHLLIVLTILLMHLVRTQNLVFFKFSFKREPVYEKDEVCILLSFFLSLYAAPLLSNTPQRILSVYSLNKKAFDAWKKKLDAFLVQFPDATSFPKTTQAFHYRLNPAKNVYLYDLGAMHRETLSRFFFHHTSLDIIQSYGTRQSMDRNVFDTRMFSRFYSVKSNRPFLVLHWKHLEQLPTPIVSLFLFPYHWRFILHLHLAQGLSAYSIYQLDKHRTQVKKEKCLCDIRDIVAYYPNNHGMMETISKWNESLSAWNNDM
jgi:hypothetical protein